MEVSRAVESSQHAVSSPSGIFVASLTPRYLLIYSSRTREMHLSFPLHAGDPKPSQITSIQWSSTSSYILLLSPQRILLFSVAEPDRRIKVDNGSAGFGILAWAEFVCVEGQDEQVVVGWEFGRVKAWDLGTGRGVEIGEVKTVTKGRTYEVRKGDGVRALALLSRPAAHDVLTLHLPPLYTPRLTTLPTTDAKSISWSSDGAWLAVVDTPLARPALHIYTADGNLFRTCNVAATSAMSGLDEDDDLGLSIKSIAWSPSTNFLAVGGFDSRITLLSTRTFAPVVVLEHTPAIDLTSITQGTVWQETVAASGARSYDPAPQPVSPPTSPDKDSTDPSKLGVAEMRFNCDGSLAATRDESMPSTIWIWDLLSLSPRTVIIQHAAVKSLCWHPSQASLLLIQCHSDDAVIYLWDAKSEQGPQICSLPLGNGRVSAKWLSTARDGKPVVLASTRTAWVLLYPAGRDLFPQPDPDELRVRRPVQEVVPDVDEDSLLDALMGKTPLRGMQDPMHSYGMGRTGEGLDDTFWGKKHAEVVSS
ncbi:hypothetical protein LTR50_003845 [Elasticomyces elasticus]|nr:hypothetical protein LTR50_003845 [Elasticomyces elasticus]